MIPCSRRGFNGVGLLAALLLGIPSLVPVVRAESATHSIAPSALEAGITDAVSRVREFELVRKEAEKLGVRVWIFGGTAAGLGQYVRRAQTEAGSWDYEYTSIYRASQDADIVIDGPPQAARDLQKRLQEGHPANQAVPWEVRPLRRPMGDKEALLGNSQFTQQHSDSMSTGLIELTTPPSGEGRVRDLRSWENPRPRFLSDLADGRISFYFSGLHGSTARAAEGKNPPIFAATRYLTKAFQYDLATDPEDLERIRTIIREFDPKRDIRTPYAKYWIEKNGKKLLQNAADLEKAVDTLDSMGLRKKLRDIAGDQGNAGSLAWWMNKEPLRSRAVGTGNGETARQIFQRMGWPTDPKTGVPLITHATDSVESLESITSNPSGKPNFFISRPDQAGEKADWGQGLYALPSIEGRAWTGLPIRMTLNPDARLGTDFERGGEVFRIHNRAAIQVLPEHANFTLLQYFHFLDSLVTGQIDQQSFANSKLFERYRRKIDAMAAEASEETLDEIAAMVERSFWGNKARTRIVNEWFRQGFHERRPKLLSAPPGLVGALAEQLQELRLQNHAPARDELAELVAKFLLLPESARHPEWIDALFQWARQGSDLPKFLMRVAPWIEKALMMEHWRSHPALLERTGGALPEFGNLFSFNPAPSKTSGAPLLSFDRAADGRQWMNEIGDVLTDSRLRLSAPTAATSGRLTRPEPPEPPRPVAPVVPAPTTGPAVAVPEKVTLAPRLDDATLSVESWLTAALRRLEDPKTASHPEAFEVLFRLAADTQGLGGFLATNSQELDRILALPHWAKHPYFQKLFGAGGGNGMRLFMAFMNGQMMETRGTPLFKPTQASCAAFFSHF